MSIFSSWLVSSILFLILAIFITFIFSRQKKTINKIVIGLALFTVLVVFAFDSLHYLSSSSEKAGGINRTDVQVAMLNGFFSIVNTFTTPPSVRDSLIVIEETRYLDNNGFLQLLFWLSQVTGRLATYIFIVHLFGKKLLDRIRIWVFKYIYGFPGIKKELCIIIGGDKNALMLGEDIYKKRKSLVLFLIDEKDDEKKIYERAVKFNGIVRVFEDEQKFIDCLKKAGISKYSLKGNKEFKVVLMPDVSNAAKKVELISDQAKNAKIKPDKLDIYTIVSNYKEKTDINKVVMNEINKVNYTVHIIDEVEYVMREMIRSHPPLECQDLFAIDVMKGDKSNYISVTANREFTILILGFRKIGRRALAHLIMNAQFINKDGIGIKPQAVIVDNDAKRHFGCFKTDVPGYSLCCNIDEEKDVIDATIPGECLDGIIDRYKIDYIVIALDNDIHNHGAAEYVNNYYRNKNNKEAIKHEIPFIAIYEKNGIPRDVKGERNDIKHSGNKEKTFTFGCRDELYSNSGIINEEDDKKAREMMDFIEKGKKDYGGKPIEWHNLDLFTQERYRATAIFSTSLIKFAKSEKHYGDILINESAIGEKHEILTDKEEADKIRINTERLRDNAYYIMHGYTSLSVKEMENRFEERKEIIRKGKSIKENENGLLEIDGEPIDGVIANNLLDYARKDEEGKRHVRLAALDETDTFNKIDQSYMSLVRKVYEKPQGFNYFSQRIVEKFWGNE